MHAVAKKIVDWASHSAPMIAQEHKPIQPGLSTCGVIDRHR